MLKLVILLLVLCSAACEVHEAVHVRGEDWESSISSLNPYHLKQKNIQFLFRKVEDTLSLPQNDPNAASRAATLDVIKNNLTNGDRYWSSNFAANPVQMFRVGKSAIYATVPPYAAPLPSDGSLPLADQIMLAELTEVTSRDSTRYSAIVQRVQTQTAVGNITFGTLAGLANNYKYLEPLLPVPTSAIDWTSDEAFASDRLTINGFKMELCKSDPIGVPEDVSRALSNTTVARLIKSNLLFVIDLSLSSNYSEKTEQRGKHAPGAIALFFFDRNRTFRPLAIKLIENDLLYTPLDGAEQWELAKLAFSAAETNWQPMEHFVICHMVLEPIRVEMLRHLSSKHPVYALLSHHLKLILGNSVFGLNALLTLNTTFDRVYAWGAEGALRYASERLVGFKWDEMNFEERIRSRGLLSPTRKLKFVQDALAQHRMLKRFIEGFLEIFYGDDASNIVNDSELQSFLTACADPAQGGLNGFPTPADIGSRADLANLLTDIVFAVAVQHHAMNSNVTWDSNALPAKPKALWAPLPTTKTESVSLRSFISPSPTLILGEMLLIARFQQVLSVEDGVLRSYSSTSELLGTNAWKIIASFEKWQTKQSQRIQAREAGSVRPYTFLDPQFLPFYCWI